MNSNGLGMIFKAMGFEPEKIKTEIAKAMQQAKETVDNFDRRLKALEESNARIEKALGIVPNENTSENTIVLLNTERNGTNG